MLKAMFIHFYQVRYKTVQGFELNDEVASSKKHTQLKTRVHKPYPISHENGQNWYPISHQNG